MTANGYTGNPSGGGGGGLTQGEADLLYMPIGGGPVVVHGARTAGDLTAVAEGSWTVVPSLTMAIPAVAGDEVSIQVAALLDINGATDFYDLAVIVAGLAVRYASTGTSSPAGSGEGDVALYPDPDVRFRGSVSFMSLTVQAGDLSGGNVTFAFVHKGAGSSKIFASTNYPLRWTARNDH